MSNLTERALIKATIELLSERPLDKVTIKDITNRCGVSRNTFYYHFQDIYDLLSRTFLHQADEFIYKHRQAKDWEAGFHAVLTYFYDNKKMINHIYKSMSREDLDRYLNSLIREYALALINAQIDDINVSENARLLTADFFKNAFVGEISQWIDEDMDRSPDELAVICNGMFKGTVREALISAEQTLRNLNRDKSEK